MRRLVGILLAKRASADRLVALRARRSFGSLLVTLDLLDPRDLETHEVLHIAMQTGSGSEVEQQLEVDEERCQDDRW